MIQIEQLSKSYNGRDYVLKDINMTIEQGTYLEIVGKSGSGKSTFLNILGMLDTNYEGRIIFDGKDISKQNDEVISRIRNEQIGFIFQAYHLIPHLTVKENIMLPFVYSRTKNIEKYLEGLAALTESLQISDLMNNKIEFLSGGEKQRVAIARALSLSPNVILADEPTGNLDSSNSKIVFDALSELKKSGVTVVLVTHNSYVNVGADKILTLGEGGFV